MELNKMRQIKTWIKRKKSIYIFKTERVVVFISNLRLLFSLWCQFQQWLDVPQGKPQEMLRLCAVGLMGEKSLSD